MLRPSGTFLLSLETGHLGAYEHAPQLGRGLTNRVLPPDVRHAPDSGTNADIARGRLRVNRVFLTARRLIPVFLDNRTSLVFVGMPQMCQ